MTSFSIDPHNDARILVGDPAKPDGSIHCFTGKGGVLDPVLAATVCEMLGSRQELVDALEDIVKAYRKARVELGYDEDGESDSIEIAERLLAKYATQHQASEEV